MTYAEDKKGFGFGKKLPEPSISQSGKPVWEFYTEEDPTYPARAQIEENGKLSFVGVSSTMSLVTAQRFAQAMVAAVDYRLSH